MLRKRSKCGPRVCRRNSSEPCGKAYQTALDHFSTSTFAEFNARDAVLSVAQLEIAHRILCRVNMRRLHFPLTTSSGSRE
jgi:cobalamin biosynthesis protein CbiG